MTFPLSVLSGATIADADLEGMTAAQVNAYGTLLPRHLAVYEFRTVTGNLSIDDVIRSQHFGGVVDNARPATCIGDFDSFNASDKGIRISYPTGAIGEEKVRLDDLFDLGHADHGGDDTDVVVYVWLTEKVKAGANTHALVGYGYQTTVDAQWMFDFDGAGDNYRIRLIPDGGGTCTFNFGGITNNEPTLFAFHLKPVSTGSAFFKVDAYLNGVKVGEGDTTPAWPLNDLSAVSWLGNPPYPIIGRRGGYNVGHEVVIHTVGLARITEHDDVAAFLAAEYALNATALAA